MNIAFIIAVVSLTLQFGTTAALVILGRAPRWRQVRWFAAVAFTAGCYSTVDAIAALRVAGASDVSWSLRFNIFFATLHGASWLIFTRVGRDGRWQSLPLWIRRTVLLSAIVVAVGSITGIVASPQRETLVVPALDIAYERNVLSPIGNAFGLIPFVLLALAMHGVWQERRRGTHGSTWVLVGFALFLLAAIEELLVASGALQFIFLGDLGYVCVVVPVTLQLFRRFRDDADRLDQLTDHLADEVQRRTDERDRAREQVLEQQRLAALGRLAAGVGHEINNPLQYLQFTLEELRERTGAQLSPEEARLIDHSFEGIDRIRQVVEDLRTYARPGVKSFTPLDVREVIRAALRVGAPQWRQGISVTTDLGDVPLVQGHEGRLVQVVLNPLVNGMQAMRQAGHADRTTMSVRTRTTSDGWAEIEIRDQGPGFDANVVSRLGEPYVTTRADQGGTGLGLFVSRGIVEAHGGQMMFANAPNGGAIVRVQLPPAAPKGTSAADMVKAITVSGEHELTPMPDRLRVLMLEDDEPTLRALVRGLHMEGVEAIGFTQGEAALDWLDTERGRTVALVVTDLMMPGMAGWEFAARLAQAHPALRASLVVLTGGASTAEAQTFVQDDGLLVLSKPIARQAFAKALRERAGQSASS